jgi:hypothetical protein
MEKAMSEATPSQSDILFYQMITQANQSFQQTMVERQQLFAQQMISVINQNDLSKQLNTTYAMTQAGNITIAHPVNLP